MSFQEYNFNKIAKSFHQLGELVFELRVVKQCFAKQTKKCHSSCNFWLAAWAYKPVLNNVILSHAWHCLWSTECILGKEMR